MKTIADALRVARSNLAVQAIAAPRQGRGRRPQPDAELLAEIKGIIAGQPTYGYRRVHALIRRRQREIGLVLLTTPIESPQSNGMAEAFVKTLKRDYAWVSRCPDAATVLHQLDGWFEHYNTVHPHQVLDYRAPREFRRHFVDSTTENAVGARRRPHGSTMSADAIGSSPPAAPSAETRSVWLDASAAVDQP